MMATNRIEVKRDAERCAESSPNYQGAADRRESKGILKFHWLVYVGLLLLAIFYFFVAVTYAQVGLDCGSAQWYSRCSAVNNSCVADPSPGAGCDDSSGPQGQCKNCSRGGDGLTFTDEELKSFDPERMFAGRFQIFKHAGKQYQRFIVTNPGILAKLNIAKGDVVRRISRERVTIRTLERTLTRKGRLRFQWYTPRKGVRHEATLKP